MTEEARRRALIDAIEAEAALAHLAQLARIASLEVLDRARLVSQWHGAIGSGPIEVLDAELGELGAAIRGEPCNTCGTGYPNPGYVCGTCGRTLLAVPDTRPHTDTREPEVEK